MSAQTMANGRPTPPAMDRNNSMPNGQGPAQSVSSTNPKLAAQAANDQRNIVRRKLTGYVGFANLPNQWHRKSVRKGFNFNVMVVGKSTCWWENQGHAERVAIPPPRHVERPPLMSGATI